MEKPPGRYVSAVLSELKRLGRPENRAGMARFGIHTDRAYGVPVPAIRKIAKRLGRNQELAEALWRTGVHEARILAPMIADRTKVTGRLMDQWVKDFDSWDICDQCCANLFDKLPGAYQKAMAWSKSRVEFVKRAGFALMACLAWHDKSAADQRFRPFLRAIAGAAGDERNFVRKAVNWALRQIGKKNKRLRRDALRLAVSLQQSESPSARWVGNDAYRELSSQAVQRRVGR